MFWSADVFLCWCSCVLVFLFVGVFLDWCSCVLSSRVSLVSRYFHAMFRFLLVFEVWKRPCQCSSPLWRWWLRYPSVFFFEACRWSGFCRKHWLRKQEPCHFGSTQWNVSKQFEVLSNYEGLMQAHQNIALTGGLDQIFGKIYPLHKKKTGSLGICCAFVSLICESCPPVLVDVRAMQYGRSHQHWPSPRPQSYGFPWKFCVLGAPWLRTVGSTAHGPTRLVGHQELRRLWFINGEF